MHDPAEKADKHPKSPKKKRWKMGLVWVDTQGKGEELCIFQGEKSNCCLVAL